MFYLTVRCPPSVHNDCNEIIAIIFMGTGRVVQMICYPFYSHIELRASFVFVSRDPAWVGHGSAPVQLAVTSTSAASLSS